VNTKTDVAFAASIFLKLQQESHELVSSGDRDGDSFRPCLHGRRVKINSARRRTLLRESKDSPLLHIWSAIPTATSTSEHNHAKPF